MNVLFPQVLLFGLPALAIPVIIHLFHLRKTKKLQFSNTRFLKAIQAKKQSRLKLKHWLILGARLLFLFFLIVAFAQPYIPSQSGASQARVVKIYIDNSLSMSSDMSQSGTALDNAIIYAEHILSSYPDNTRFQLLTNDFAPFSNLPKSKDNTREILTELSYSAVSRALNEVLGRINNDGTANVVEEDIYIISDFQRSTLGKAQSLKADSSSRYYIVPMGHTGSGNVFFDSLYLGTPYLLAGEANTLNAVLRNSGVAEINDIIVKLFLDDLQVATASVNIPAGATETIAFPLSPEATQTIQSSKKGRIAFEEFPVTFDNEYFFSLNLTGQVKVAELTSGGESPFKAVFGNKQLFAFSSYDVQNMDYNQLFAADLIILYEPGNLPGGLISSLTKFTQRGGSLLIVPGMDSSEEQLSILTRTNTVDKVEARRMELATPDLQNPFYVNIFDGKNRRFNMPQATQLLRIGAAGDKVMSFKNQDPFLVMREGESGYVFIAAGPFSQEYSDFSRHALFVPVMYRIASMSKSKPGRLYFSLDEKTIALSVDSLGSEDVISLRSPESDLLPAQRYNDGRLVMDIPQFSMQPGYYDMVLRDSVLNALAFNYSPAESFLQQADVREITDAFFNGANVEIFAPEDAQAFKRDLEARFNGLPLWKYVLALALLFLLIEIALIRLL